MAWRRSLIYFSKSKNIFQCIAYSSSYSDRSPQTYLNEALYSYEDVKFMPFRIRGFILGRPFSDASVEVVQYLEDADGNTRDPSTVDRDEYLKGLVGSNSISFRSMFSRGFESLEQWNRQKYSDSDDYYLNFAFLGLWNKFLKFKDYHERSLRTAMEEEEESIITAILAIHLFSPLASSYIVSNDISYSGRCPCPYCNDDILFGNSTFGSEYLFYGRPDILVFPLGGGVGSSIIVPQRTTKKINIPQEELRQRERQIVEVKQDTKLRLDSTIAQVASQAVAFSVYQKIFQKRHPRDVPQETLESGVTLIPSIAVSTDAFDIYLYDSVNDILLRNMGKPIPLWKKAEINGEIVERLNLSSVLMLWMAINHLSVKPSLTLNEIENFYGTCGFLSTIPKHRIGIIEKTMKMQKKFRRLKETELPFQEINIRKKCMPRQERWKAISEGDKK